MRWIKTIRARFALWATGLILVFLAAFSAFIYLKLSYSLHASVDEALSLTASQTAASLNVDNGKIIISEPISSDETGGDAFGEGGMTLIVISQDGQVLESAGSYQSLSVPIDKTKTTGGFLTYNETTEIDLIRVYTLPVMDNNQVVGWVQTMQSLQTVETSLQQLLNSLLLGGAVLILIAGIAGYILAARTLAPIDAITNAARRISVEDLSARLELPDTGDEVSRLAGTFNQMLDRIETGFRRERQFTADASHELRTPLAAMQAILSVTRQQSRTATEYEQSLDDLMEETDRLKLLTESLLQLARTDLLSIPLDEKVQLSTILEDVSETMRPLAEAKGLALTCETQPNLVVQGNSDGLIRVLVNLLDNAIKYTENGGVHVSAVRSGEDVVVKIADTGIGIPEEHQSHVFDRFYRVEQSRTRYGAGLGLAIVQQIVMAHGGEIRVTSTPESGTTFTAIIPSI